MFSRLCQPSDHLVMIARHPIKHSEIIGGGSHVVIVVFRPIASQEDVNGTLILTMITQLLGKDLLAIDRDRVNCHVSFPIYVKSVTIKFSGMRRYDITAQI